MSTLGYVTTEIATDGSSASEEGVVVYTATVSYATGGVTVTVPSVLYNFLGYTSTDLNALVTVHTNSTVPYSTSTAYVPIITSHTANSATISVNQISGGTVQEAPAGLTLHVTLRQFDGALTPP